ncbi:MAG: hypothetical protein ACLTGT_03835 [Oscillospiraceae bacterium]
MRPKRPTHTTSVTGIISRISTEATTVRRESFRFSTGVCTCTGGGARRPIEATSTNMATRNTP